MLDIALCRNSYRILLLYHIIIILYHYYYIIFYILYKNIIKLKFVLLSLDVQLARFHRIKIH